MKLLENLATLSVRGTETSEPVLPERFMAAVLDSQDRIPELERASVPGYIHVSSLIGMCGRRTAIMQHYDMPMMKSFTGGHRVTFAIGRHVEKHIRAQFLAGRHFQEVYGIWKCLCGDQSRRGFYAPDRTCSRCSTKLNQYHEHPLFDEEAKIVGNPDLLFRHDGYMGVVEIKSMAKGMWDELTAPLADHVFQAAFYRRLLAKQGFKTLKKVVFVYCAKDFKWGSPYKEFHVDVTTPAITRLLDSVVEEVISIRAHVAAGTLPKRTVCRNANTTIAKECAVVGRCFNSNDC